MRVKNLTLMISAILFIANSAFAMEKKEEDPPEFSNSSMVHSAVHSALPNEGEKISIGPLDLFGLTIEKTTELSPKKKISKTLPLKRRKSSGSPRAKEINPPKLGSANQITAFLEDQTKNDREEEKSLCSFQKEQTDSPRYIIISSPEDGRKSPRPGYKRYSLVGPIEYKQIPFPNSFQDEQKISPGRDGAISPMRKSRDPNL